MIRAFQKDEKLLADIKKTQSKQSGFPNLVARSKRLFIAMARKASIN